MSEDATEIEFMAIPSGDYHSFCWDVTEAEFRRLSGSGSILNPSFFHDGLFRLYQWTTPGLGRIVESCWCKVRISSRKEGNRITSVIVIEKLDGPVPGEPKDET